MYTTKPLDVEAYQNDERGIDIALRAPSKHDTYNSTF